MILICNCGKEIKKVDVWFLKDRPQSGSILIMDKKEIRKEQNESPDYSDTLMMAIYGIYFYPHYFISNRGREDFSNFKLDTEFDIYD